MGGEVAEATFFRGEVEEVLAKHPGLRRIEPGVLQGLIEVNHAHDGVALIDRFRVRLTAGLSPRFPIPSLFEIGGRTEAIAQKHRLGGTDALHKNHDGSACVCVAQERTERFPPGSSLLNFVENLAIPYLYSLSYFERFGRLPWGEYSHGAMGLLEYYDRKNLPVPPDEDLLLLVASMKASTGRWRQFRRQLLKQSGKRRCPCGSGKPFTRCHSRARRGLKRLLALHETKKAIIKLI